jgi:hypothetical protein
MGIDWFEFFGGRLGLAEWCWILVLGFLACCAWSVVAEQNDNPPPVVELAKLAKVDPTAEVEWSRWENAR